MTQSARHPAVDASDGHHVLTETRAAVAYLSGGRADLLRQASAAGRPVLLVSDEVTRLTVPLHEALREAGGAWVVRGADGSLRDGSTGRGLARVAEATRHTGRPGPDDVAPRHLRAVPGGSSRLAVAMSVRHRDVDRLGLAAEVVARVLTGAGPRAWGEHEPAARAWVRVAVGAALTGLPRVVVVGGGPDRPLVGTVRARADGEGLVERVRCVVGLGGPGGDGASAAAAGRRFAAELCTATTPLVALVQQRVGAADLTVPSVRTPGPVPVGLLVGQAGIRELGVDVVAAVRGLGGQPVGRPRNPGVWFDLTATGTDRPGDALAAVLDGLGRARLEAALRAVGDPSDGAGTVPDGEVEHG